MFKKSLMLPLINQDDPFFDMVSIRPYAKPFDFIAFAPILYPYARNISLARGSNLATGGIAKDPLIDGLDRIPEDVEYVTYDYEPAFCPEFTDDQTATIAIFNELKDACHALNKKLIVTPVYWYGRAWDWGEVSKACDILSVQIQNYQINSSLRFPTQSVATTANIASLLRQEIIDAHSTTSLFVQMGTMTNLNPYDISRDVFAVEPYVSGVVLWHNADSSHSDKMNVFLNTLELVRNGDDPVRASDDPTSNSVAGHKSRRGRSRGR